MRFWFDMGVDGMRLDAVPYLIEREGTTCENLPETHQCSATSAAISTRGTTERMLLAEANQWPADVRSYFGEGDECHMAFNFPLMPRIYMALQTGGQPPDRRDPAPDARNPGVLPVGALPPQPRRADARDGHRRGARLSCTRRTPAIRRCGSTAASAGAWRRCWRTDRQRIELLTGLLFSLPGTPVVYYGDEIGMGDNIYLGDRNGGAHADAVDVAIATRGFSRADPARLFAPLVMDPVYGYQAINVEAQERSPASLLNWMKRADCAAAAAIAPSAAAPSTLLSPSNRKVLALHPRSSRTRRSCAWRTCRGTPQPAELDLSAFKGRMPVELIGDTEFPRIGERPYFLTLGRTPSTGSCCATRPSRRSSSGPRRDRRRSRWRAPTSIRCCSARRGTRRSTRRPGRFSSAHYLPQHLATRRWFSAKSRPLHAVRIRDYALVGASPAPGFLTLLDVSYADGGRGHLLRAAGVSRRRASRRTAEGVARSRGGARQRRAARACFTSAWILASPASSSRPSSTTGSSPRVPATSSRHAFRRCPIASDRRRSTACRSPDSAATSTTRRS